jgi:hypothetical protein
LEQSLFGRILLAGKEENNEREANGNFHGGFAIIDKEKGHSDMTFFFYFKD